MINVPRNFSNHVTFLVKRSDMNTPSVSPILIWIVSVDTQSFYSVNRP